MKKTNGHNNQNHIKIIELFNIETGTTPSTKKREYWEKGNINWITPSDLSKLSNFKIINSERKITEKAFRDVNLTLLPRKSIVISTRAPVGYIAINEEPTTINQGCKGLIPKENKKINIIFYAYLLSSKRQLLNNFSGGSTFKELTKERLENLEIPFPSLPEQQKIVEVLSAVDDVIEKINQRIEKTEKLKQGLMRELLTKGIGHKEFKNTEIGKIPKEWEAVRLQQTIKEINTGFASGKRDPNGIVQIRMNNVTTDGRIVFDSYLKVPIPANVDNWLLKTGDFLFNNTNSYDLVGKSAVFHEVQFPCTYSNHFTRIRFNLKLANPYYILYHFLTLWKKSYFKTVAIRHVGQSAVNNNYLLNLTIPLPSIDEQEKIVMIINGINVIKDLQKEKKNKYEQIKKQLMNDLLTGKKRTINGIM